MIEWWPCEPVLKHGPNTACGGNARITGVLFYPAEVPPVSGSFRVLLTVPVTLPLNSRFRILDRAESHEPNRGVDIRYGVCP